MAALQLPVNIDTAHPDSLTDVTIGDHQRHHDAVHAAVNHLDFYAADCGVVGDGATDATAALQALLNSAAAVGRTVVLESNSTVMVDTLTLPSRTHLNLNGATIKKTSATVACPLNLVGVTDVLIENGTVDGDKASYAPATEYRHGINVLGSSRVTVRNVISVRNKGDGVYVGMSGSTPCSGIVLEQVICDASYRNGMTIVAVDGFRAISCQFINTIGTAPEAGVDIEPDADTELCKDLRFIGCNFDGNNKIGISIVMRATPTVLQEDFEFLGCTTRRNALQGVVLVRAKDVRFVGGRISENNIGLELYTATDRCTFTGVQVVNNTGRGVYLFGVTRVTFAQCVVRKNTTGGAGFAFDASSVGYASSYLTIIGCDIGELPETNGLVTSATLSHLTLIGNNHGRPPSLLDDITTRFRVDPGYEMKGAHAVTGSRPAAATAGKGGQFYDDTLAKPIWSDGSAWKDAAGTTV